MEYTEKPVIICLTPVKNEAWILDRFLKAASLWADYIIVADQYSTDGSKDICKKYAKVIWIENNSVAFNEPGRQKLLIDAARKIEGPRLLIALDADEMLSPNFDSPEWGTMLYASPGTIFVFERANLNPDLVTMWVEKDLVFGYMDDGAEHTGAIIHSMRFPISKKGDVFHLHSIKVLHFQYLETQRLRSKHAWYQCFERVQFPEKSNVKIFRIYNHYLNSVGRAVCEIPKEWFTLFVEQQVDITSVVVEQMLWWDTQVLDYMNQYGIRYFARLNIWTIGWPSIAEKWDYDNPEKYKDPRNMFEKLFCNWLIKTQGQHQHGWVKMLDKIISLFY